MSVGKRQSIGFPDLRFDDPQLNRLMEFMRGVATEMQRIQQLLRAGSQGQVLTKKTATDYDGIWTDNANVPTVTGAENIGPGQGIFAGIASTLLEFKSLIAGGNITLTPDGDSITITASATLGGGTVTSVGIASTDLSVAGSPIGTSGVITLNIKTNVVTYAKIQQTSSDAVVLGRKSGDGVGNVEELTADDLLAIIGNTGYAKQLAYAGIT